LFELAYFQKLLLLNGWMVLHWWLIIFHSWYITVSGCLMWLKVKFYLLRI